jgi:hypothetical protein
MTDSKQVITNEDRDSGRERASQQDASYIRTAPAPILGAAAESDRPEHQSAAAPVHKSGQAVQMKAAIEKSDKNQSLVGANKWVAKLPPEEEAKMLKRASDLMNQNDVASARLIYKYLGEHGSSAGESLFERTGSLGDQRGVPR